MGKARIKQEVLDELISLRESGMSIKEIAKSLHVGVGTASKYSKDVTLSVQAKKALELKRFPSKIISENEKRKAYNDALVIIKNLNKRDSFLIFCSLYWGEGTKSELSIINGDPALIKCFVNGLLLLGLEKSRIKISIRYYSGQDKKSLVVFWLNLLALESSSIVGFEMVPGNMVRNKLQYGMCRVRVQKGSYYHKLVISGIKIISSGSSTDRTEAS